MILHRVSRLLVDLNYFVVDTQARFFGRWTGIYRRHVVLIIWRRERSKTWMTSLLASGDSRRQGQMPKITPNPLFLTSKSTRIKFKCLKIKFITQCSLAIISCQMRPIKRQNTQTRTLTNCRTDVQAQLARDFFVLFVKWSSLTVWLILSFGMSQTNFTKCITVHIDESRGLLIELGHFQHFCLLRYFPRLMINYSSGFGKVFVRNQAFISGDSVLFQHNSYDSFYGRFAL